VTSAWRPAVKKLISILLIGGKTCPLSRGKKFLEIASLVKYSYLKSDFFCTIQSKNSILLLAELE
jgi:hypothetical protein